MMSKALKGKIMLAPWVDKPRRKVFLIGDIIYYPGVKVSKCLVENITWIPEYKTSMYVLKPFEGTGRIMVPFIKMQKVGAALLGKATA